MNVWVLSLDIGTTSVKAAAVTLDGQSLASRTSPYRTHRPRPNVVEHDPNDWWAATRKACAELFGASGVEPSDLVAVGLSGMAATHVLLGADGGLMGPAIIWQDTRATREAARLNEQLGEDGIRAALGSGIGMTASMQGARMLWLHENAPELLAGTRHILGSKDYLLYLLTGELATDRTSCSGLCHILTGELHAAMASATGVDASLLPPRLDPTTVGGRVTAGASRATGIPEGTPVAVGMIDSWCNILGAAVTDPGDAFDTAGTAEVVGVAAAANSRLAQTSERQFLTEVALSYGVTQCGTDALTWYGEVFPEHGADGAQLGEDSLYRHLDGLADSAAPGADGLIFLPYLQGERAPFSDSRVRAGFHGVHRGHRRPDFVRSVLEGVAFSVRHVLEAHEELGEVQASQVVVTSGGSKSRLWNQIKADVVGRPFASLEVSDAGSVGAAILGAVAVGRYSITEGVERMVRIATVSEPQPGLRDRYDELYGLYLQLGTTLRDVHHRIADYQAREG
ncbi:MAG: FGGY family carbohydrate kinase [Trueperaceae bacterium]